MKISSKCMLLASMAFCTLVGLTACQTGSKQNDATPEITPGKSSVIASHSRLTYNWERVAFNDPSGVQVYIDKATITSHTDKPNWYDAFLLGEDSQTQSTVFSVTADCEAQTLRINNAAFYDQSQGRGKPFSIKISNGDFATPKDENEKALMTAICPAVPPESQP